MTLLILTHADVAALLPMPACIDLMATALGALARGQVVQPQRTFVRPPGGAGMMLTMPSYVAGQGADNRPFYGLKAVLVHEGNRALGLDSHQGAVLLFNGQTGEPLAVMNAAAITAIRTAAVSGLATRLLARPEAGDLALIGTGVQAASHLAAMAAARPLRRVRVASRDPEHARRFAAEHTASAPCPLEAVDSVEAAVRGADIVVTATNAREPIVPRAWVAAGAHVNAVGAFTPTTRELEGVLVAAARLFVDAREAALAEAGDILLPLQAGLFGPEHIQASLGELVIGAQPGRGSAEEITVFKSLGLPVEDAFAAEYVYRAAEAAGAGKVVEF